MHIGAHRQILQYTARRLDMAWYPSLLVGHIHGTLDMALDGLSVRQVYLHSFLTASLSTLLR